MRPAKPIVPFALPDSIRPLDPTVPIGSMMGFSQINTKTGGDLVPPQTNQLYNFGHEYVWHCHILSHEENDMMRSVVFQIVPGKPRQVSAVAGTGLANVFFTAPSATGGSPIKSYTVTSSPGGITATGTSSPITVTGLTAGTPYTFKVKVVNAVGTGPGSAPSNSVTPL